MPVQHSADYGYSTMPTCHSTVPGIEEMMRTPHADPLHWIAEHVADCFAESGYAFIEEDKIVGLAAVLGSFLTVAGIPVNPADTDDTDPDDEPLPRDEPASTSDGRYPATRTLLP
jgi:hypothetical protein